MEGEDICQSSQATPAKPCRPSLAPKDNLGYSTSLPQLRGNHPSQNPRAGCHQKPPEPGLTPTHRSPVEAEELQGGLTGTHPSRTVFALDSHARTHAVQKREPVPPRRLRARRLGRCSASHQQTMNRASDSGPLADAPHWAILLSLDESFKDWMQPISERGAWN